MASGGTDDVLLGAEVREARGADPTWRLLAADHARWILPLFSECLEFATEPVPAHWFHQRVAEARSRERKAVSPDVENEVGGLTPADYGREWADSGWLDRVPATRGAPMRYQLSPHAFRALRIVRELIHQENTVSEARLGSISDAVRKLADMSNPNKARQLKRIEKQIAELMSHREDIKAGHVRVATAEEMARQLGEVLRLTASLPEDFRRLGVMVESRHREASRRASTEDMGKGAIVEEYLRENDLLDQTPEGRAYRGFAHVLSTHALDKLRSDIDEILSQDFARTEMTTSQRAQIESLVSSLLRADHQVQEVYLRWTASLRRFVTRSAHGRHQRLLQLTEAALEAGRAWANTKPGPTAIDGNVLGIGALDVKDISQTQLFKDPGPQTVSITIETNDDPLPESERAALRVAAGTAPTAVADRINTMLTTQDRVTGREVYDATPAEFQRLGTLLSLLDLGVNHGHLTELADDSESVSLRTEHGHLMEVTLPHVFFDRPIVLKGPRPT